MPKPDVVQGLHPDNDTVSIATLACAAKAMGKSLSLQLF
jgi:hypothetical protein